jgi:hypothetical protein
VTVDPHCQDPSKAIETHLRNISGNLADAVDSLAGLGIELEALIILHRAMATHWTGDNPLSGTSYDNGTDEGGGNLR